MYQTYKPSGKVSWVFFLLLALFLFLFIPPVSFLYIFIMWYCPSVIADGILYFAAVYLLALFGSRVCIRGGKARNLMLAGISGILGGAVFFYMLLACYYLLTTGDSSPVKLAETLSQPEILFGAWKGLAEKGFPITTVKGTQLFTLQGGFFIAVMVVLLLVTVLMLVIVYVDVAWVPFCEKTKKWAVSRTIYLEYIEDKQLFIKKLAFGDMSPLQELDVLKGVNCSHSEAELYIMDKKSDFYITIVNKKKREGETDKDGEVKYDEEDIMELLRLDHTTGEILLSRAQSGPEQASAAVVTEETGKNKIFTSVRMAFAACIQAGLIVLCFKKPETMQKFFSNGIVWYYLLITLFINIVSLIGSLVKEDVMIKNEDQLWFNETKRYQIERRNAPLRFKIYYGLMIFTSILIFIMGRYIQ